MARRLLYPSQSLNTGGPENERNDQRSKNRGNRQRQPSGRSTAGVRFAQNSLLSELPGVVFGLITLGYLVSSLLALA